MHSLLRTLKWLICLFLLSFSDCCSNPQMVWTPAEMMKLKMIKDVQISPDHETALFVATEARMAEDQAAYISRIYQTSIKGNREVFAITEWDSSAMQPRCSHDGKWIAFLSKHSGINNLYIMDPVEHKAIAITDLKYDVQTFKWCPDSRRIAFVSADDLSIQRQKNAAYLYEEDSIINRLWVIDIQNQAELPKALTRNEYHVRGCGDLGTANEEFDWSPDSKEIIFAHSPLSGFDKFYLDSSLAILEMSSGKITPIEKHAQHESMPRYSPDGYWISYLSSEPVATYAFNRQVMVRSRDGVQRFKLAPTSNEGLFLAGPNLLGWTADSQHVLFFEPIGTKFHIVMLPRDGKPGKELIAGNLCFKDPILSCDGKFMGFIAESSDIPPEAFVANLESFQPLQISELNRAFISHPSFKTQLMRWKSTDGLQIEGLLTYPYGYQKGVRYPLLLVIHGGPMSFFDEGYLGMPSAYPLASFAEAGFMVLRANPRGSCGYGKTFRCLNYGDWGGKDYQDLMAGIDAVIEKGLADPQRLGVMGWSYGGYMTAWIITQTTRFQAASVGAGISNLVSASGTLDLHRLLSDYFGDFGQGRKIYHQRSPLYYAHKVATPCQMQHGLEDKRVPVSQAYEFYHALKRNGKEATLILYPGMGHRFSDPKLQLDLMERNLNWFSEHLN